MRKAPPVPTPDNGPEPSGSEPKLAVASAKRRSGRPARAWEPSSPRTRARADAPSGGEKKRERALGEGGRKSRAGGSGRTMSERRGRRAGAFWSRTRFPKVIGETTRPSSHADLSHAASPRVLYIYILLSGRFPSNCLSLLIFVDVSKHFFFFPPQLLARILTRGCFRDDSTSNPRRGG